MRVRRLALIACTVIILGAVVTVAVFPRVKTYIWHHALRAAIEATKKNPPKGVSITPDQMNDIGVACQNSLTQCIQNVAVLRFAFVAEAGMANQRINELTSQLRAERSKGNQLEQQLVTTQSSANESTNQLKQQLSEAWFSADDSRNRELSALGKAAAASDEAYQAKLDALNTKNDRLLDQSKLNDLLAAAYEEGRQYGLRGCR